MRFLIIGLATVLFSGSAFAAKFVIDSKSSTLDWEAAKVTGKHNGQIKIKSGQLQVMDGMIKAGEFVIDMTSISVLDIENEGMNKRLVNHLKSDDFFSAGSHDGEGKLKIKTVKKEKGKQVVMADLTLKGITKPISFPVDVFSVAGGKLVAKGTAELDRTQWDIKYKSGKFFPNLGDKMIYDKFTVRISLSGSEKN